MEIVKAQHQLQPMQWTPEQVDLLRRTLCPTATDDELALFAHVCKRTGLDPFVRQIYPIKRWNKAAGREVMSIQTGIDGYRAVAERTGTYAGNDDPIYEHDSEGRLLSARVTVWRIVAGTRCPFTATARWSEYVQTDKNGNPTKFWAQMPYLMLGKVAEALALRKAFPADLSGIYTHEEMQQADNCVEPVVPDQAQPVSHQPPAVDAEMVGEATAAVEEQRKAEAEEMAEILAAQEGVSIEAARKTIATIIATDKFKAALQEDAAAAWGRLIQNITSGKYKKMVRGL